MTLLLATDLVELYPPAGLDSHGQAQPGAEPCWTGAGNLQAGPGASDPRGADGGGRGPFGPASHPAGLLFLPMDASPVAGWWARIRGQAWALSQVRLVMDPAGGGLDCWMATVAEVGGWPDG